MLVCSLENETYMCYHNFPSHRPDFSVFFEITYSQWVSEEENYSLMIQDEVHSYH